jgi:tripartite-type tricarboxylate transporter receptor subunit TctC
MKLPRRSVLRLAAGGAAIAALPRIVRADAYPARPVRLIVGGTPGSAPDVIARLMAQWLSGRLGQSVFVENKNGASDNLATEAVVDAIPDGYTLLLASASNAINATLFANLKFDFIRDIAPIAGVVTFPMVITVNASLPAKRFPDLLADAKAHPGKINIGTPPLGSPQHVAGELLKMMSGADICLCCVPRRSGGDQRRAQRTDSGRHRHRLIDASANQVRRLAGLGGDQHDALCIAARNPDGRPVRAGFRSRAVGRHRRAEEDPC